MIKEADSHSRKSNPLKGSRLGIGWLPMLIAFSTLLVAQIVHAETEEKTVSASTAQIKIALDWEAKTFNKLPPFDIPLVIEGKVPLGTKTMRVEWAARNSNKSDSGLSFFEACRDCAPGGGCAKCGGCAACVACGAKAGKGASCPPCVGNAPPANPSAACADKCGSCIGACKSPCGDFLQGGQCTEGTICHQAAKKDAKGQPIQEPPTMVVNIPPLEVDKYYYFRFMTQTPRDEAATKAAVKALRGQLDEEWKKHKTSWKGATDKKKRDKAKSTIAAIKGKIKCLDDADDPTIQTVVAIFDQYAKVDDARGKIGTAALKQALELLPPQGGATIKPGFAEFYEQIEKRVPVVPGDKYPKADSLVKWLLADKSGLLSKGGDPDAKPATTTVDKVNSAEEIAAVVANYTTLIKGLKELRALLNNTRVSASHFLHSREVLGAMKAADAAAMTKLLDKMRQDVWGALNTAIGVKDKAEKLAEAIKERDKSIADLETKRAEKTGEAAVCKALVIETDTFRDRNVNADIGILYGLSTKKGSPYMGISYSFGHYVKELPLEKQYKDKKAFFARRTSFVVGLTALKFADANERTRSDLVGDHSLVTGLTFRVAQSTRLGVGLVWFRQQKVRHDATFNPLKDRKELGADWYISYSFNQDASKPLDALSKWVATLTAAFIGITN